MSLPKDIAIEAGLNDEECTILWPMNDGEPFDTYLKYKLEYKKAYSFLEIADYIEANIPGE